MLWGKEPHIGSQCSEQAVYDHVDYAVEEMFSEASNVEIGNYDKDNVVFQGFEYYDFGYGTLRYARYAVSVPAKWDTVYGQMDERLTINVYYYTSRQNISDGVDTSVPDHIHTEDILQEFYDLFEDIENFDDFTIGIKKYGRSILNTIAHLFLDIRFIARIKQEFMKEELSKKFKDSCQK